MSYSIKTAFERALDDFKNKAKADARLTDKDLSEFNDMTLEKLERSIQAIQNEQTSERRQQAFARLKTFLEAISQFGTIVEVFANATLFVAWIWGPMKFLLQTTKNFSEGFEALLEAYEELGESIPLLRQYRTVFEDEPRMAVVLELIFTDILNFHLKVLHYFRRSMWKQLFQATWKAYKTRFSSLLRNFRDHRKLLDRHVDLTTLENLKYVREQIERQIEKEDGEENMRRRWAVFNWLAAHDPEVDQYSYSEIRKEFGTGDWLLDHAKFQMWFDSRAIRSPLLWLTGVPGAGKTILASLVIEKARTQPGNALAFFYCKHGDASRNSFVGMAKAMLSQLLRVNDDLLPYLYEKCSTSASLVSSREAEEYLRVAMSAVPNLIVVLDGLDECPPIEQKLIFKFLTDTSTSHSSNTHRCFISSQHGQQDAETRRTLLPLWTHLSISATDNERDIVAFAEVWCGRIQSKFELTDEKTKSILRRVCQRSTGMFLYTKLVLSNLHQQTRRAELNNELEKPFPDGLEEAYERILDRIRNETSAATRADAMTIIEWLVCTKRSLKWHEIQGAQSIHPITYISDPDRRLVDKPKDLCGSLVEIRSDGTLELVHLTARRYLINKSITNVPMVNLALAETCIGYLSTVGFANDNDEHAIQKHTLDGYYSFLDYAMAHWSDHLRDSTAVLANISNHQWTDELLENFLDLHVTTSSSRSPRLALREDWLCFNQCNFMDSLLLAIAATDYQHSSSGFDAECNEALDLPDILFNIREVVEHLVQTSANDLLEFYGDKLFKCRRINCWAFYEGFKTAQQRDEHMAKHDRPFKCSFHGCMDLAATMGVVSLKDLRQHLALHDRWTYMQDDEFPEYDLPDPENDPYIKRQRRSTASGKPNTKKTELECDICQQQFSRRHNLNMHRRTHDKVKPFACPVCGTAFARKYDMNRHGATHAARPQFVCKVHTTTGSAQDHGGCQKGFADITSLLTHLETDEGQHCMKPALTNEDQIGTASKYYTSSGLRLPSLLVQCYKELQNLVTMV